MRRSSLIVAAVVALAGSAQADILWNQLPAYDSQTLPSFPDRVSGTSTVFAVSDVSVPASGWTINSISTYFSDLSFNPTVTSAVLNIFPKSGGLPLVGNDPRPSPTGQGTIVVPVDVRTQGGATQQPVMIITAQGLNIVLGQGEYWIGLTPSLNSGPFGSDNHWPAASVIGSQSAARGFGSGPGATFAWGTVGSLAGAPGVPSFDLALTVNGTPVPAPSSFALLGLAGLALGRRRR